MSNPIPPKRPRRAIAVAGLLALVAAFLLAPAASAVEQTGEIQGTVRDEKQQPFPGTTVTLKGDNLQGERSTVSDAKGEYAFRALPPGHYTITFTAPGYAPIEQEGVVVNIGRTTTVPADLAQTAISEQVSVSGTVPLVDRVGTTTQDNYGPEYLEEVQIGSSGRDYLSVVANSAGTGPGDGANITVRGSTIGGNVYLVDGVDSTDPVTQTFGTNFIYDALEEVQLQTGGFNAEYGRVTGGIVNVVTKSGGNTFDGSIDARYRNQNFNESGDHFDPDQFDTTREVLEGTLGGPILKDKLWFFVAGSYTQSDFAGEGYESVRSFGGNYYLGKMTWQATPKHKFVLQATGDPATIDNVDAGPLTAAEASSKQTQGSQFFTGQYEGILSPNFILNVQAAYYDSTLDVEPQSGDLDTIGHVNFFTGRTTRNALDAQFSDRSRDQMSATLTWHKSNLGGSHTFKFGVDMQKLGFDFNQFTPGGEYREICTPDEGCPGPSTVLVYHVSQPAGPVSNEGSVQGYFAQDEWAIHPRVTVNFGLRFDTFSYDDDQGATVFDADLIQPRLGVAWDITGDAKNVVKAFGGRYSDTSLLALPRVVNTHANAEDVYVNENFFGDLNGDTVIENRAFYGTFGGPGGSVFANNGDLKATSVVEYQASYERQLDTRSAVGATFVRRKTYDIIEDRFDAATGVYVIDNLPQAERNYYGLELRYRTQFKNLFLSSSYTWGKSRGSIEYTQSLGTDFDFPVLSTNRYGYLSDDTRHAFRFNGYYRLPHEFQITYGYQWLSGYPWTTVTSTLPYGVEFLEPRGSQRLPDLHQLDMDVRKKFKVGTGTLEGILSIINLFDSEIVTSVNTNVTQAGQATTWQTPRRYEIGVRYAF